MLKEETIRDIISRVNSTLSFYEKDYISVPRTPVSDEAERCGSFEQFIEARFNFEACQIPELYDALIETDGHLFVCSYLENPDTTKRKFTTACIVLAPEIPENLRNEILELFGGCQIKFNNVKKKIKFIIE